MPCDFPEHHGSGGGSGIAGALVVLLAALVGVAIVGPLLHILAIIGYVLLGAVAFGLAAGTAWLVLSVRHRVRHHAGLAPPRAARLPGSRQAHEALPHRRPGELHLPPGITADDIADALIRRHQQGR